MPRWETTRPWLRLGTGDTVIPVSCGESRGRTTVWTNRGLSPGFCILAVTFLVSLRSR